MGKLLDSGILNKILTLQLFKSCLLQISAMLNLYGFTLIKQITARNISNVMVEKKLTMFHKINKSLLSKKILLVFCIFYSPTLIAHNISIDDCRCEEACYTEEVSSLKCNNQNVQFQSNGLPHPSHSLMVGITGSNQQFPTEHNYEITIPLKQNFSSSKIQTEPGAIGIAINGVPLFDPQTQGPQDASGKRSTALDQGELDECGGHAGRGDDYHYHIAPNCLIEDLGYDFIENQKRPIGYAKDGYPILAIGWFDENNNIETLLDECRGMFDINNNYFYNVKSTFAWDLLNCFSGEIYKISKDKWVQRLDTNGKKIVGMPIKFTIEKYEKLIFENDICHTLEGTLREENILQDNNSVKKITNQSQSIFYCHKNCYGLYFEAEKRSGVKGRIMYYDLANTDCPAGLNIK